ncbi:DUF2878 domain-containing protein [Candidatus Methylopumilus turicensis]|uniref:Transmembrane protein n=1 Tax=Candidatus Methylopumilus turicensis TaxID=1581680 RepID=A0A0B7IYX4_9PROT|nr:DUF2878 domain-containing protein [Candidatus Methylopumilus turicensis]CEN55676.1 conserved membrane protein of unknown function [Candidatus Methylopumilus turicensis]
MLLNIIGFQIGWFSCVLGAANQRPWMGVFIACLVLSIHLAKSSDARFEFKFLITALIIGIIFDGIPQSLGWITFNPVSYWPNILPPPWMIMLWALFASTLNISLSWLQNKNIVAILIGAVAGPVSYWSGARLGALTLSNANAAMIYLAIGWGLIVPLLLKIAASKEK